MRIPFLSGLVKSIAGTGVIGIVFLVFVFVPFVAIGWVLNILDLLYLAGSTEPMVFTNGYVLTLLLRVLGIFAAPLGAVMGWFF